MYFEGYWQSEKFFKPYKDEIIHQFSFPPIMDSVLESIIEKINLHDSVSIHIRRGDYLNSINRPIHGDICTLSYYAKACEIIESRIKKPHYYVFSDDVEWARNNIVKENCTFVDCNVGRDSYKDMQLMSQCKSNIIANSSFSWWAAYLNPNPDKIVIAPGKWFNSQMSTEDLLPKDWIKIN